MSSIDNAASIPQFGLAGLEQAYQQVPMGVAPGAPDIALWPAEENVVKSARTRNKKRGISRQEGGIRAQNEEAILNAAVKVFSRNGYEGARVSDIAKVAELPLANIYYYFESKENLYRRVIMRLLYSWDSIFTNVADTKEPAEAFRSYIFAHFSYTWRHRIESRLFATEMISGARFMSPEQRRHIQNVTDERATVVENWIKAGKLSPIDVRQLFILIWSATQYYPNYEPIVADTIGKNDLHLADYEAGAQAIADIVLHGILPNSSG